MSVYELRTYVAAPGRLDDLLRRFREHTLRLFEAHGMTNVGYFMATDEPVGTLVYLLAHDDREAATASWQAFGDDPRWQRAKEASEADGPLVTAIESVFLEPTDFSALR